MGLQVAGKSEQTAASHLWRPRHILALILMLFFPVHLGWGTHASVCECEREGGRESELSPYTIWDLEIELR